MFTLPPWPPKDYVLKDVSQNYTSNQEFSPYGPIRNTQPNVGKYLYPIQYGPEDSGPSQPPPKVAKNVIEKWLKDAKADWVDKPNENADLIHEFQRKYTVQVADTYDPTYKLLPKLFPRSYKYEIDYMINKRLDKITEKMKREAEEEREWLKRTQQQKLAKAATVYKCDVEPPGWWKEEKPKDENVQKIEDKKVELLTTQQEQIRWQSFPRVFDKSDHTLCKRRTNMALVGQPFKHEACLWYFENYPPPDVPFRPEKLI